MLHSNLPYVFGEAGEPVQTWAEHVKLHTDSTLSSGSDQRQWGYVLHHSVTEYNTFLESKPSKEPLRNPYLGVWTAGHLLQEMHMLNWGLKSGGAALLSWVPTKLEQYSLRIKGPVGTLYCCVGCLGEPYMFYAGSYYKGLSFHKRLN